MTQTNPVTVYLTTNVSAVTTYQSDPGSTMEVAFLYLDSPLWTTMVSHANQTSLLMADKSVGDVTLKANSQVNLSTVGQTAYVLFTGTIAQEDSGTPFTGYPLATFQIATS